MLVRCVALCHAYNASWVLFWPMEVSVGRPCCRLQAVQMIPETSRHPSDCAAGMLTGVWAICGELDQWQPGCPVPALQELTQSTQAAVASHKLARDGTSLHLALCRDDMLACLQQAGDAAPDSQQHGLSMHQTERTCMPCIRCNCMLTGSRAAWMHVVITAATPVSCSACQQLLPLKCFGSCNGNGTSSMLNSAVLVHTACPVPTQLWSRHSLA